MMRPKAILFDLFGTLVIHENIDRSWQAWQDEMVRQLMQVAPELEEAKVREACVRLFEVQVNREELDGLTPYEYRIRELAGELRVVDMPRAILRRVVNSTIGAWNSYNLPDPEAAGVLASLSERFTMALVTNWDHPPYVYSALEEWGLARFFEAILISGEVGYNKPSPEIFGQALSALKVSPTETWHIGDTAADIEGARAAGITPILINRVGSDELKGSSEPPRTIAALHELIGMVDTLQGA